MIDPITRNLFNTYPRFFGSPKRWRVNNLQQLEKEFKLNNGINPCFISLYDIEYVIDKVWVELDASSIEKALIEARKLTSRLDASNLGYYTLFSGSKGFHFYIPVEPVKLPIPTAKVVLKQAQQKLVEGIERVDVSGHGDINRMVRIPCSINQKTNHYCTYLPKDFVDWSAVKIVDYAEQPHETNFSKVNKLETILEKPLTEVQPIVKSGFDPSKAIEYEIPQTDIGNYLKPLIRPCVLASALDPEAPHDIRTTICSELMHLSFGVDEIVAIMKRFGWSDFDENTTKYHVKKIFEMGVKPTSCQRLQELYQCKCDGRVQWWYEGYK